MTGEDGTSPAVDLKFYDFHRERLWPITYEFYRSTKGPQRAQKGRSSFVGLCVRS